MLLAVYKALEEPEVHMVLADIKLLSVSPSWCCLEMPHFCIAFEREPMQYLVNQHAMAGCTKSALLFRLTLQCYNLIKVFL